MLEGYFLQDGFNDAEWIGKEVNTLNSKIAI